MRIFPRRKTACSAMHTAFSSAAHAAERLSVNERTAMQTTMAKPKWMWMLTIDDVIIYGI